MQFIRMCESESVREGCMRGIHVTCRSLCGQPVCLEIDSLEIIMHRAGDDSVTRKSESGQCRAYAYVLTETFLVLKTCVLASVCGVLLKCSCKHSLLIWRCRLEDDVASGVSALWPPEVCSQRLRGTIHAPLRSSGLVGTAGLEVTLVSVPEERLCVRHI